MTNHPFDLLMEMHSSHIHLDCAALHMARDCFPGLPLTRYRRQIDEIAAAVSEERPGLSAALRYEAMRAVLVDHCGLRGNEDDYYDPLNSYLNCVLDRRVGIPITLSILWLEVARRLKWPVSGIGFPGHFIVRFDDEEQFILVDPFRAGRTLSIEDCRRTLDHHFDGRVKFTPKFLEPVGVRTILTRLLNNLRNVYIIHRDWQRVVDVLRRLAAVEPDNLQHREELAGLLYHRGDVRNAYAHLSLCLEQRPDPKSQYLVREKLAHLEAVIAALN